MTIEEFLANETLRRAFVRSLEIIGEAAEQVPEDFLALYPTVEWRAVPALGIGSSTTSGVVMHGND